MIRDMFPSFVPSAAAAAGERAMSTSMSMSTRRASKHTETDRVP